MTAPAQPSPLAPGPVRSGPSTIRDLIVQRLGVPVAPFFNRQGPTFGATATVILKQDPTRVAFVLVNPSGSDFLIAPTRFGNPLVFGLRAQAGGGTIVGVWDEDGEMIAEEWQVISTGGAGVLALYEYLIVVGPGPGHGP